ncbi:MAG: CRISPR-associated protein Cas5 [Candidatus Aminicenantes bacterium]|nr:CRISPR-associated protein Cas5 [Candidatus Aminicenantes bacterium]NIM83710.1 CRISPR-associated protein Cas5 [Candidatus Aminicenantes bacterium]NIN23135.1 CRISPR-associated protein Cas5 [Candidatus Aminicenantes bacterium]NIN46862.1 CRISPR-associated protein Cas5 [Candidatus Aminicenantes bacterium]NIN89784.1 CRISPR-associated protein Cas5 [Candidatus Aminicenantes bacterium]
MEELNVLRLIFRQPTAHYRVGFTQMNLHRTLPLPPPSTLIGFIHRVMECKKGEVRRGFDIAVCGHYESIFYQYQTFRDMHKTIKPAHKEASHYRMMPNQVQLLNNVYLRIYLRFDDFEKDAPLFMEKLNNPCFPFIIGRGEDLAVPEDNEIKPSFLIKKDFPQKLELNYWASQETVEAYKFHGPVYLLGTYYRLEEGMRNFERKRFYYIESQQINPVREGNKYKEPVGWVDIGEVDGNPEEIPVFFLGIDKTEFKK